MSRNAPTRPKSSEVEIREAVESVARRSGLSAEGFLARVEAEMRRQGAAESGFATGEREGLVPEIVQAVPLPALSRSGSMTDAAASNDPARTAMALDSVASWIERTQDRLAEEDPHSPGRRDPSARSLSQSLGAIQERLDTLERRTSTAGPVDRVLVDALATMRADLAKLGRRLDEPGRWLPAL